ncbi:MAG: hypothetical protein K2L97_00050 [Muribaculaceae bacterium]|nr:hypothetical protein [Muribaculaceae bacterium]
MDFSQEYLEFVKANADQDPQRLRLKYHGDCRPWLPLAINNIAALKKDRKFHLSGDVDLTPAVIPHEISAQQSTSAQIALLHANLAGNARSVLDMTFGLGMDARLMAMDHNRTILGFDLNEDLADAASVNFADFPNVEVRHGDSVKYLNEYNGDPYDLIFIDPARRGDEGQRLYNLHDCTPDLTALLPTIKEKSHHLMGKLSPMLDITQTIRDLPAINEIHIVEVGNECKELLAVMDFDLETAEPQIIIDRLIRGQLQRFSFTRTEERACSDNYEISLPKEGDYLLEPSAATMKAAPFNLLSARFHLTKLHPNTHLYIAPSDLDKETLSEFPGYCYRIVKAMPFTSSNLKQLSRTVKQGEVVVRNLKGFTTDTLRKRLKIKPGGDLRLYAVTAAATGRDTPILLLVQGPVSSL